MTAHINTNTLWEERIPGTEWAVYERVIQAAAAAGIPFSLGGGFGFLHHTGHWRPAKDIDIYIRPQDRARMVDLVAACGLRDYFPVKAYERHWIYRSHAGQAIVDIIWASPNRRFEVDDRWLTCSPAAPIRGLSVPVLPVEELIFAKLFVLQRDRCDWTDIMNLLSAQSDRLDWDRLLQRLGNDVPLLTGALSVFSWLAPEQAEAVPAWVWDRVHLQPPATGEAGPPPLRRAALLDSRPWFMGRGQCQAA